MSDVTSILILGISDFNLFSVNSLLPKLPLRPGIRLVTVNIVKIGLKDASEYIDPFFVVSCKGKMWYFGGIKLHDSFEKLAEHKRFSRQSSIAGLLKQIRALAKKSFS